jgi:hypothetical protein
MATNYTNLLGFALPTTGELAGTWGQVVNDSITELVEDSIAGTASVNVTSGDVTLTTTGSGAANEARCAIIRVTGTPGTARNVIAPSSSKAYIVINQSDSDVTFKGAATTGHTLTPGQTHLLVWNGSDFIDLEQGNVYGPASSTDNAIARYDGTTGKFIQNSSVTIDDSNNVSGVTQLNATTADLTNLEVTNIKAKDGTAAATIADSTGVITVSTQLNVDNLNLSGNTISSTDTDGNIVLAPNGTGDVQIDADTLRVGDSGADATIQSNGNADLILKTGNATTGQVTLADGSNGNLTVALNGTGQIVVNAGAVGTPTIAPTGDLNTGIFFPAADEIAFAIGGAEDLRITSAGYTRPVAYADTVVAAGNTSTALTLNLQTGNVFTATLTGNATITLSNPVATGSSSFTLILTNDGTAGRTVAWAGGSFNFPGGVATLSRTTTANATDIWAFFTPNGGTTWYGNIVMKDVKA